MTQDNNANKPTDNAGQITAEENKLSIAKMLLDKRQHGDRIESGQHRSVMAISIDDAIEVGNSFASLVSEERCRKKEAEIKKLDGWLETVARYRDEAFKHVQELEKKIAEKDWQLEEVKQNEVKAIKTMLDQADRIKELKQQLGKDQPEQTEGESYLTYGDWVKCSMNSGFNGFWLGTYIAKHPTIDAHIVLCRARPELNIQETLDAFAYCKRENQNL